MSFEEQLKKYRENGQIIAREDKIIDTIVKSKAAFYASEQDKILSYQEFLWIQLKFIGKRWWFLQMFLLAAIWALMKLSGVDDGMQRDMGVAASLFVILIIPELWKNRTHQSMEIESASFYSLKQVYAARLLLFAMVDVLLISIFCCIVSLTLQLTLTDLMVQFLLPLTVTACICFQALCSRRYWNEVFAVVLCMIWSAVWSLIILNERVYAAVTFPVWLVLMGISILYLCVVVYQTLSSCNSCWEEKRAWN